jgi:uncharacterized membrane protein YqjE
MNIITVAAFIVVSVVSIIACYFDPVNKLNTPSLTIISIYILLKQLLSHQFSLVTDFLDSLYIYIRTGIAGCG